MVWLIPYIKSAYQIRSCVKINMKRRTLFICNCINNNFVDLNISIYITVGVIRHWPMFPKRILNVDLSHSLKCTKFFP